MAQFYAPEIAGKIPAQYGNEFHFSFIPSRANPTTQLAIKIKHLTTDTVYANDVRSTSVDFNQEKNEWSCTFNLNAVKFQEAIKPISEILSIGTYYKIQIAHCEYNNIGTYSAVGIFKYTGEATLQLEWQDQVATCHYFNDDYSEKIDWYQIDVYEKDTNTNTLISSSGQIVNNSDSLQFEDIENNKTTKKAITVEFAPTIIEDGEYYFKCKVVTFNALQLEETSTALLGIKLLPANPIIDAHCDMIYEEGLVRVTFSTSDAAPYRLLRREAGTDEWEILHTHNASEGIATVVLLDKSCEQYQTYEYGIQQEGHQIALIANTVICDFEDCFLSDSERQLKIRFNPKVNNFKRNIQESKTDTIGGIYPIFFRNGNINYFEFSINGLISMRMDDNQLFQSKNVLFDTTQRPATPSEEDKYIITKGKEFQLERQFKREVYDWLTNGKPKLFRSATEGNFIVRLMNVNLTPEEQLSRMLHSFQATAYEIAPCTIKNLSSNEYNLAIME